MALALKDRVKETTIVVGTGSATLLGSSIGFQPFSVVGNGNTTYYCISDQFGSNWEVGIGTYSSSGNTLTRTTVLASSNGGALVVFTAGIKDVFVTYPAEKGVWLDASGNAIGLGTPAAFVGTNITGTASGLTAGNVTTNANLTGAVTSTGNATSLGSFTSAQLALAISDETGTGKAVFATNPTLTSPTYAGTLTGSTGILNLGSGQLDKAASGNVGIGTSSPGAILHTFKTAAAAATVGAFIQNSDTTVGTEVRLGFAANTNLLSQDRYGWIGYVNTGGTNGGALTFATTSGGTPATERMRIDSSGNVGIGTSSPTNISGNGDLTVLNRVFAGVANASYPSYSFIGRTDSGMWSPSASTIAFSTGFTERMRLDSSGNVGIGTSSPASKLNVVTTSSTAYGLISQTPIVGLVAGNTVNMAYFSNNRGASNDGLRIINYRDSTGSGIGNWETESYAIERNIDNASPQSTVRFGTSYLRFDTAGLERMRIDSSGNVGIGTSSPTAKLHLIANSTIGQAMFLYNGTSANYIDADTQAFRSGNGTERMRIDSSGNLLVGTTSATPSVGGFVVKQGAAGVSFSVTDHTSGTATNQYYSVFTYAGTVIGHIDQSGTTGVAYVTSSDQRLKTNIVDAPSALASVNAIKVRSFDWKSDSSHVDYGYIAQELLEVAPEAVSVPTNEDEMMGVDFGKLTPRLVKAIQEQQAIISDLKSRLEKAGL
jgi:hypothetical protein